MRNFSSGTFINAGCGMAGGGRVPGFFSDWDQIRVDIDPSVTPDILASITDLGAIPSDTAQAVWNAHCLEHLFIHDVPAALKEFHRVLTQDGFACILVPDFQTVASYVANNRLHEVLYVSPSGPITAHDVVFGHGAAIRQGFETMAHRCGFTPDSLGQQMVAAGFAEATVIRRPETLELAVVAPKRALDDAERTRLVSGLDL